MGKQCHCADCEDAYAVTLFGWGVLWQLEQRYLFEIKRVNPWLALGDAGRAAEAASPAFAELANRLREAQRRRQSVDGFVEMYINGAAKRQ